MPVFLAQIGTTLAGIGLSMIGQLVTERFMKAMVVKALQGIADATETKKDNELLDEAKRAWNVQ